MAELIPWDELEAQYAEQFHASLGAPAKSLRLALGALLAKERLHCSDIELVEHFEENPYLQYFLGLETFHKDCPFDDSSLTNFRKYLGEEVVNQVNETVIAKLERLRANQQSGSRRFFSSSSHTTGHAGPHPAVRRNHRTVVG